MNVFADQASKLLIGKQLANSRELSKLVAVRLPVG